MMSPLQLHFPVIDPSQIGEVRRATAKMAQTLPLSDTRRADAAIVASELATNLVRHARDGRMLLRGHVEDQGGWLELLAIDGGPGMTDLRRCLTDGYSTNGTAGNGLGAVRRLSDVFDAYTLPGKGTVVLSRIVAPLQTSGTFAIGAVRLAAPGEEVCGDTWRATARDGQLAVMLADGLGHGPAAATAADLAGATFEQRPFAPSLQFYLDAHTAMIGSRGAAVARAVVSPTGEVEYSGIGNIAGSLVSPERGRGLASTNGTVGVEIRRHVPVIVHPFPNPGVLVMHSDGITSRWSFDEFPGLLVRHPSVIAGVLSRDFRRGRDDATVVVVSRNHKGYGHG
jgi:anti-sigma regulatory factor (Ser/Thr protein kinase)